jgi:hypothetical protein
MCLLGTTPTVNLHNTHFILSCEKIVCFYRAGENVKLMCFYDLEVKSLILFERYVF